MSKQFKELFFFIFSLLLLQMPVYAGGPLVVKGGKAVIYNSHSLKYRYDTGTLGKFTNSEAVSIIEDLFMSWENIPTADIRFEKDTPSFVKTDITKFNFEKIFNPKSFKDLSGFTPIIFDENGEILNSLIGDGAANSVIGVGGPNVSVMGSSARIIESVILLNGMFVNGEDSALDRELSLERFEGAILHEIGHAIGLDHSQININSLDSGASQEVKDSVPLMFPIAVPDPARIMIDDKSALSFLYPNIPELSNFGEIKGTLVRGNAITPVLGANVILRSVDDPLNNSISCVSDFLKRRNGEFIFSAIPPGKYKIEIEPISINFAAISEMSGSTVGPYAMSINDSSFANPVSNGFYTGVGMVLTEDESKAFVLNVSAGQKIEDLEVIASLNSDVSVNEPLIGILSPDIIEIKSTVKKNKVSKNKFKADIFSKNFDSNAKCTFSSYSPEGINAILRPKSIVIGKDAKRQKITIEIPKLRISGGNAAQLSIKVNCSNGASDSTNILFIE